MAHKSIQEAQQRAFRYYYEDGLVEIAVGGLFTVIGSLLWVYERMLAGGPYAWLLGIGLLVVTGGGVFAVRSIVMRLKAAVTYPRTGRVTYSEKAGAAGRWLVIAAAVALALAALFWLPDWLNTTAAVSGALLTVILLYLGTSVGLVRMQAAAMLPVAAGVLASYFALGEILGSATVFAASGVLILIMGLVALRSYLARNPLVEEQED